MRRVKESFNWFFATVLALFLASVWVVLSAYWESLNWEFLKSASFDLEPGLAKLASPAALFKLAILWLIFFIGFRAYGAAQNGRKEAAKFRDECQEIATLCRDTTLVLIDVNRDEAPGNCKDVDWFIDAVGARDLPDARLPTANKRKRLVKAPAGQHDAQRLAMDIGIAYRQGRSPRDAEATLAGDMKALETHYERRYFREASFAKGTLPLIGFGGTIVGIMLGMGKLGKGFGPAVETAAGAGTEIAAEAEATGSGLQMGNLLNTMGAVITDLSVAFDTTLLALVTVVILKVLEKGLAQQCEIALIEGGTLLRRGVVQNMAVDPLTRRVQLMLEATVREQLRKAFSKASE